MTMIMTAESDDEKRILSDRKESNALECGIGGMPNRPDDQVVKPAHGLRIEASNKLLS
jgi:hypothetical protein